MRQSHRLSRLALRLLAGAMLVPVVPVAAAHAAPPPLQLSIRADSLGDALTEFARQSNQQILFAPEIVAGKRARALRGNYTAEQALDRLLKGTGLRHRVAPGGAFLIVRDDATAALATPQDVAAAGSDPAQAEDDAPAEDIVVIGTAGAGTRRQDAAFAVTTLSNDAIDQISPASTADLFRAIPGVSAESSGGQNGANIFVRGYPSGGDAQFVTLQTQGVPFFPPSTLSFLENSQLIRIDETLQRVEAVRGGTGALFSAGQPGLTVNFVQKQAGSEVEGLVKLGVTDFGEGRIDAVVSGPIGPNTGFMIGGYYAQSDGIRDAEFTAEKGGQITANLSHEFDRGSLLVFGRYLDDRGQWLLPIPVIQDGNNIRSFPGFDAGTGTFASPQTRRAILPDGTPADLADGRGARIGNVGINFDYELANGLTVRDRASYLTGSADTTGFVPGGATPQTAAAYAAGLGGTVASLNFADGNRAGVGADQLVIPIGFWTVRKDIDAFVNDLALEFKSGGNTLTGGFYYTRYESDDLWNLGNAQLLTAEPNARRLDLVINNGGVLQQATRNGFAGGSFFNVNASYEGEDIAFYLVDELQVTDQLRIDAGIRYQNHTVDGRVENNSTIADVDGNPNTLFDRNIAVLNGTFNTIDYEGDEWSWTLGANYEFSRQFGAFARYSRGHTFPQFDNLRDGLDITQRVDSYEIGLKASTDLLNLYVTLFRNEFEGLASTQIIVGQPPLTQIGGAETNGVELEGALRPFEGLQITGSLTYLDASYVDFFSANGTIDNTGNRVQRQPEWQWRVTPSYKTPIGDRMEGTVFTTIGYTGDRFSDVENLQVLPNFVKWDAGVTLKVDDRWTFQLYGDNLTDEIGLTEGNPRVIGSQGSGAILARPILGRLFRFTAAYQF
ncbi:TonB-dependent siderophore receptor [Sphingomonas sp. CCH18-H6]|uniref:TonB-dependent siderophore receptor n=2 Tax=unclassified Sphingomonas TaxID=196159 RepID=UPI000AFB1FC0|nr:TonB-dependent receptor [Sphingomonas sp. CCH18-H6]